MNNATTTQQAEYGDEYIDVIREDDGTIHAMEVTYGPILLTFDGFQWDAVCAFASDRDGIDLPSYPLSEDATDEVFSLATREVVRPAAEAGVIGADALAFWED